MSFRPAALFAALISSTALAQPAPEPGGVGGQNVPNAGGFGSQAFADPSLLFSGKAGAYFGVGFNRIAGEGDYISTTLNTEFSLGPVGLGLGVPLNLLVYPDNGVNKNDIAYGGVVRKRDWDEWQSYLKVIRYVRYGHKRDPVYFLAGQLWGATIGHGTLVNRYANSLSLDHTKFGLTLDFNSTYVGVETLTDSLGSPNIVGGRFYVRPFGDTLIL